MIASGSFSGHFDLRVYDANTGALTKSRSFPNLITNQGLASYCGNSPSFYRSKICVGNGTGAPAPEDTELHHFIAVSTDDLGNGTFNGGSGNYGPPDYISWTKGTVRFAAGTFDGTTLAEIGVTNASGTHPVFSRALILDEHGLPSAIVVLANEYLDVTYTLFYHPNLNDTAFSFVMNGETYSCIARAAYVNDNAFRAQGGLSPLLRTTLCFRAVYNTQTLGDVTGEPIYSSKGKISFAGPTRQANVPYSTDMPYMHRATDYLSAGNSNFDGGIGAVLLGPSQYFLGGIVSYTQISITPKLPKDENTEMTFVFSKSVSRFG